MSFCDTIAAGLGQLFVCSEMNGYTRVRTPFLYPDGDVIDIFVREAQGSLTITDLGETLRWLMSQSISAGLTQKQTKLIEDICLNHGLEWYKGMLMARATSDNIAAVAIRLSQGALRMADIWFTMRTRSVESFTDEVDLLLVEKDIRFERTPRLSGRSGRIWRPNFHTRMPRQSSLVFALSTGSRAAARDSVEHVFTAFSDLSHLSIGPEGLQFVSLFDDSMNVWGDEDFNLLRPISNLAYWSKPNEFVDMLAEAA